MHAVVDVYAYAHAVCEVFGSPVARALRAVVPARLSAAAAAMSPSMNVSHVLDASWPCLLATHTPAEQRDGPVRALLGGMLVTRLGGRAGACAWGAGACDSADSPGSSGSSTNNNCCSAWSRQFQKHPHEGRLRLRIKEFGGAG